MIPIILLAAGGSTRMGQPKQLLPWGKQTLIEHQLSILQKTGNPVLVVLGAESKKIIPLIEKKDARFVVNKEWETGMGSSIAAGVKEVSVLFPEAGAVLVALLDQPLVSITHYNELLTTFQPGKQQIIASHSEKGWLGVPAVYDRCYFQELIQLANEQGAKKLIKKYPSKVIGIKAENLLEDMDTMEGYLRILEIWKKNKNINSRNPEIR